MVDEITFKGGETADLIEEFNERKKYKEYSGFDDFKTIDTLFEKFNYGILNKHYQPVSIIVDVPQSNLQNFPDFAEDVRVLPFVAKAFEDFRADYVSFVENGPDNVAQAIALGFFEPTTDFGLLSYPKYLEGVTPVKGYLSFEDEYTNYLNFNLLEYLSLLADDHSLDLMREARFESSRFRIFMKAFLKLYRERARRFPLTKSGFSTSSHCSIMTTGLCLELAELDYDLDGPKGEMITTSDFKCFADFANTYGFFIDKHAPWRLIADLDSQVMKEYIVQGHNKSPDEAITYFDAHARTKNHLEDLHNLDAFVTRLYISLYGEQSRIPLIQSPEFQDKDFWIGVLLRARFMELGVPLAQEYEKQLRFMLDVLDIYGIRFTIQLIGLFCGSKLREIYGPN